jgi:hypothetical protein
VTRRLLGTYLLLTLVVLLALEVPLAIGYRDRQISQLQSGLERDAFVLASFASDTLAGTASPPADLAVVASNYNAKADGRVVIVDSSGEVLADSDPAVAGQRNFASRPEIADALNGQIATGSRYSTTLGNGLVYVAVPVSVGNRILGAVRVSYSTDQIDTKVRRYWLLLAGAGLATLAIAAVVESSSPVGSPVRSPRSRRQPRRSATGISPRGPTRTPDHRRYEPSRPRSTRLHSGWSTS